MVHRSACIFYINISAHIWAQKQQSRHAGGGTEFHSWAHVLQCDCGYVFPQLCIDTSFSTCCSSPAELEQTYMHGLIACQYAPAGAAACFYSMSSTHMQAARHNAHARGTVRDKRGMKCTCHSTTHAHTYDAKTEIVRTIPSDWRLCRSRVCKQDLQTYKLTPARVLM
jgi:hypothetical protein